MPDVPDYGNGLTNDTGLNGNYGGGSDATASNSIFGLSNQQFGAISSAGGGLLGGIMGSISQFKAAEEYGIAKRQAYDEYAEEKGLLPQQTFNEQRIINEALGKQRAGVAGHGFEESGSELQQLRDLTMQGYMAQQAITYQNDEKQAEYMSQAQQFSKEQSSANLAGFGDIFGAILGAGSGLLSAASLAQTGAAGGAGGAGGAAGGAAGAAGGAIGGAGAIGVPGGIG